MENKLPIQVCEQAIAELIELRVSGIALAKVIIRDTYKREENILQITRILKDKYQLLTAIIFLQTALEVYPENEDMFLELAECWIMGNQLEQALGSLQKIKNPKKEVLELICELEKVINNENI